MSDKHVAKHVIDDEETLVLEEKSRSKMSEKAKDPKIIDKNISHKPIDYEKLNRLTEDFRKCFTLQQELSAAQAFWFYTFPNAIKPSAKKVVVTPKNKSRKLGLKCSTSNYGSKPVCNKKNDGISQTTTNIVPPKKSTSHSVETQKPELKVYNQKSKNVNKLGSRKKAKIVESKNANHLEPNHTWGSNATDILSYSSLVMTSCPNYTLVSGLRMFETCDRELLSAHEIYLINLVIPDVRRGRLLGIIFELIRQNMNETRRTNMRLIQHYGKLQDQSLVRSFDQEKNNSQAQQKKKMVKTSSSSENEPCCSKACKKHTESLNSLSRVKGRLVEFKNQEIKFCEKIRVLEFNIKGKTNKIEYLTKELDNLKNEKEGYSAIPSPPAQVYSPPKKDMSWTGLPEFANDTITDYTRPSPSVESNPNDLQNSSSSASENGESTGGILTKPEIKFGNSQNHIDDKGYWDNGCSRHMTGNISYLSDYEPFDGGTPRQHNMYSIDLNNIVPHKDLTCLVVKASADESKLWHMRLDHLNFKTINKLVRHNLVRGLPTKCFENDHNCTACLKGKQHKASCKTKLVNSVT
nr:ribonuclease H-like domain-containing protein [Tanacetum cinerariifolium]